MEGLDESEERIELIKGSNRDGKIVVVRTL